MATAPKPDGQMTVDEFLAMTAAPPDGERWELIEGVAYMNASPTGIHQTIAMNVVAWLRREKQRSRGPWFPMLGIGTRVPISPRSLPQPDILVTIEPRTDLPTTADALVLFEILSKSSTKADQAWRKRVYASVPNCQHYVTVAQSRLAVTRYDRAAAWTNVEATSLDATLELPALGRDVSLPIAEIYRWTPLGPAD